MIKDVELHNKQWAAFERLNDNCTCSVVFGGASRGGKSYLGCFWLLQCCLQYPGTRYFMARKELKRLKSTTLRTFYKVCSQQDVPAEAYDYNGQKGRITFSNGSEIDLLALKHQPSDPLYQRFGSTEYTHGFIDEASEVTREAVQMLLTRIGQHKNDEFSQSPGKLLMTCNPSKNFLYHQYYLPDKKGNLPDSKAFIQSLYSDNPYRQETTKQSLDNLVSTVQKQRLRDGIWEYSDSEDTLISEADLQNLSSSPQRGERYIGCDVARFGKDKTVFALMAGNTLEKIKTYSKKSIAEVSTLLETFMKSEGVPPAHTGVDVVGLGAGVADNVDGVIEISGGAKPTNDGSDSYQFNNLRSQMYWQLRDDIRGNNVCFSDFPAQLRADLTAARYDIKGEQTIKIESKKNIKKRLGRSPDLADAVVYANAMRADIVRANKFFVV